MKYKLKTKLKTRLEKVGKKTRLRRKTCDLFRRPLPFLSAYITFSEELARYGAENVAAREKKLEEENSLKALKIGFPEVQQLQLSKYVTVTVSENPKRFKRNNILPNNLDFWCLLNKF